MEININKDWRITSDSMNYVLQNRKVAKTGKKKGEDVWNNEAYAGHLDGVLRAYLHQRQRESDAKDLKDLVDLIKEIEKELIELTKPLKELKLKDMEE